MGDYFKNKPLTNRTVGIVTSLFIACLGAFIIEGMELLDAYTSYTGWTAETREKLPLFYAFVIGAVLFHIIKRRITHDIYKEMESKLDD